MKRALTLLVLLLSLGSSKAWAQEVVVGGETVMRVESAQEARAIQERIEARLSAGTPASALKVDKEKEGFSILWGDVLIVHVTKALAQANKSEAGALTAMWFKRLKALADEGLLHVHPAKLELPINGEGTLDLSGTATGQITVEEGSGRVAISQDGEHLKVAARAVGKTKIVIHRGQGKATVFVHVKDWAGYPPETVSVQVVGDPAPGELVQEASLRAVAGQTRVNAGCRVSYGAPTSLPSIPSGEHLRFNFPIKIEGGDDYYPVSRGVNVVVTSVKLDPVEPNLLLVSNRPESVDTDGILMDYTLSKKEPSRLMYSHMNGNPGNRYLWVNLRNPGTEPVQVLLGSTSAGPSRNEVLVGHTAAQRFLGALSSGYVLTIPPRQTLELAAHELERRELVSGFVTMRILEGEKLQVQVLSKLAPGQNDGSPLPNLGAPFNPFKIHPHGVFAQPFFEEWWDYKPGQAPLSLTYGESPWLIDFQTGLPNTGNFGVVYRWHLTLTNPTNHVVRFGLSYLPVQGSGASSILVDGELLQANFRPKSSEGALKAIELKPQEEKTLDLVTLPEASSNYPAAVRVRELQPGEAFVPDPPGEGRGFGAPDRRGVYQKARAR